jgi:Nucleotidyl transferase of unknown function (DUF2204)
MEMDQDFREFGRLLLEHDVRFLIVGGYAVAVHGAPRFTGDLDTWIWIDRSNAERVLAVLEAFGFGSLPISAADLMSPDLVIQLGYPPHRIDLLTGIDGVEFDEAWHRRVTITVDGDELPFISRDDLITNKKAAARPQDLADVAALLKGNDPGSIGES